MTQDRLLRFLVLVGGLFLLGAGTLFVASWCARWPLLQRACMALGNAAVNFALGLTGLLLVALLLRYFGVLQP